MNNILADNSHEHIVPSEGEPFLASIKLHLHAKSVSREQRHKKHQDAWYKDSRQTIVVRPLGIGYHVGINCYGLERRFDLFL